MIDQLIRKIKETKCPVCVGLDTMHTYLPDSYRIQTPEQAAAAILDYNKKVIDSICGVAPSVKIQTAYYEMYGPAGVETFLKTIEYAKQKELIVIADCKRNDIGSTAAAYSKAYLGRTEIAGKEFAPFDADFLTVNGYLGSDGVRPFIEDCEKYGKGIFVLVKTSNPSSGEFQDMDCGGKTLYERVADKVDEWGKTTIGEYGYSAVGAVVGATYQGQAKNLRQQHKNMFFLIPGYGAQGATARDLSVSFDERGLGGVVNSSRGILLAYRAEKYKGMEFDEAARAATLDMKEDILAAFAEEGKEL